METLTLQISQTLRANSPEFLQMDIGGERVAIVSYKLENVFMGSQGPVGPQGPAGVQSNATDQQVLYNDAGVVRGDSGLLFNKTTKTITIGGATVTVFAPVIDATQTWNAAGVAFTGLRLNVIDQASAAGSLLMDLQVGGVSKFSVRKDGVLFLPGKDATTVATLVFGSSLSAAFPAFQFAGNTLNVIKADNSAYMAFAAGNTSVGTLTSGADTMLAGSSLYINSATGNTTLYGPAFFGWPGVGSSQLANSGNQAITRLYRDADHVIGQRNGTNAQQFNVYSSYTDASNYARLELLGNSGSYSRINAAQAGTGTNLGLILNAAGHIFAINGTSKLQVDSTGTFSPYPNVGNDNAFDLGTSSYRFRNAFLAGALTLGGNVVFGAADAAHGMLRPNGVGVDVVSGDGTLWGTLRAGSLTANGSAIVTSTLTAQNGNFFVGNGLGLKGMGIWWDNGSGVYDAAWFRESAGVIGQRVASGSNVAQGFNLYNSYTDASNWELLSLRWTSNLAEIATRQSGTGSGRALQLGTYGNNPLQLFTLAATRWQLDGNGHFFPFSNNSYDLGTSALTVRTGYFGTSVNAPRVEFASGVLTIGNSGNNFATLGTSALAVTSAHFVGWSSTADANSGAWDVRLYRDANSVLGLRGNLAAALNIYGAYTDASNYERLALKYLSSGVTPGFQLVTENAGTGVARDLVLNGATGVTHVAGDFHVGRGSSNSQLLLRSLVNDAGQASGTLSFSSADNVQHTTIAFYTAGNAGTLMGAPIASGLGIVSGGNIGIYASGKDINLGGVSSTAPSWSVKGVGGHLFAGADNTYDIGATAASRPRNVYVAGQVLAAGTVFAGGNAVTPNGFLFTSDPTYGMGFVNGNLLLFAGGVPALALSPSLSNYRIPSGYMFSWSSATTNLSGSDTGLSRLSAGVVGVGNGTAGTSAGTFVAGAFYAYNLNTDASNYDRVALNISGNFAQLITQSAGTGVARHLALRTPASTSIYIGPGGGADSWIFDNTGGFTATADNLHDIGTAATNRPRTGYFGTSVNIAGGAVVVTGNGLTTTGATDVGTLASPFRTLYANKFYGASVASNGIGFELDDGGGANNSYLAVYRYASDWYFATSHNNGGVSKNITFGTGDLLSAARLRINAATGNVEVTPGTLFASYNAYTDDTNYERLSVLWGSNVAQFFTQQLGTGVARELRLGTTGAAALTFYTANALRWEVDATGNFLAGTDNSFDIGAVGATRPRTGYFGTSVATPAIAFPATQVPSADVNTLDDYEEGTFTPTIDFAGTTTGITYTVRIGNYTKIGNVVDFNLHITLSAKGAATGQLNIGGLPFPSNATANNFNALVVSANALASITGSLSGKLLANATAFQLTYLGTGTATTLTNANVAATTDLIVSGTYCV